MLIIMEVIKKGRSILRKLIPPVRIAAISLLEENLPIASWLEPSKEIGKVKTRKAGSRYRSSFITSHKGTCLLINISINSNIVSITRRMVKRATTPKKKFTISLIIYWSIILILGIFIIYFILINIWIQFFHLV